MGLNAFCGWKSVWEGTRLGRAGEGASGGAIETKSVGGSRACGFKLHVILRNRQYPRERLWCSRPLLWLCLEHAHILAQVLYISTRENLYEQVANKRMFRGERLYDFSMILSGREA